MAKWALKEGGSAFVVDVKLTSDPNLQMTGTLSIYDVAGNLVHFRKSFANILPQPWPLAWKPGETAQIGIYWNGLNDQGMRTLPGVYRALLRLSLTSVEQGETKAQNFLEVAQLGVRR